MSMHPRLTALRRCLTALGLTMMGLAFVGGAPAPADAVVVPTYAYLSGGTGHYVHVIDDATKTLSTTIGPMSNDSNWRCNRMTAYGTPDGSRVFQTATCQLNGVSINTATNTYTRMGWAGTAASFSPDSQYIYVTQAYYRNAYRVSDGSNVWGAMSPCYRPYSTQWSIATSQDGSKIYLPYQGTCSNPVATFNQVDVLDAATGQTLGAITHANMTSPGWTMAAPTGNRIYVGSNGYINVINSNTDAVIASWPIGSNSPVAVSDDGSRVYVATGTVVKQLNAADGSEITSYPVSTGEGGISLNPAGTHLYVLANGGSELKIVRLSDASITTVALPAGQASRTIAWGQVVPAPNISLSASSGTAYVGESATSLYTVSNSGGTVNSYSIAPSLPSGLSFNSTTGRISGTPSATQSAITYTITATNSGGTSTATFALTITNPPPTTTTSTTVATTSPTNSPVDVSGGNGTGTGNTTTNNTGNLKNTGGNVGTATSTSTTVTPATSSTTTTTTIPAPDAPEVAAGESSAVVDGETVSVEMTRLDNSVVLSAGGISANISGLSSDGSKIALSDDGTLRLEDGDRIVVEASGYAPNEEVEVWMFSTPQLLGTVTVDATGRFANNFDLPLGLPSGDHRLVLKGKTDVGQDIVLGLGINVGSAKSSNTLTRWLIAMPVAAAIGLGLIIPTTVRRRRRNA